jgi:hypothetical protein
LAAFTLKPYQGQVLRVLEAHLRAARLHSARAAFDSERGYGCYNSHPLGETPCVCLRIPTGGGKTLLAAHATGLMAREWPSLAAKPLELWLVPSDTIRAQTLAALRTPGHPFRAGLQHPSRSAARDVVTGHLRAFVIARVRHLVHEQRIPMKQLARHQYPRVQRLALRIAELHDRAAHGAFRQLVLDGGCAVEASAADEFRFDPAAYPVPANKRYEGKFRFAKHFYPVLADLKDGGEEWLCAQAIDRHPQVRHWVRNLDSDPEAAL